MAYGWGYFGGGTGRIVYDDLKCSGDEIDFVHCQYFRLASSNCNHSEDVGVRCGKEVLTHELSLIYTPWLFRNVLDNQHIFLSI